MQTLASGEVEGKGEENKISRFPKCTFNPLLACFECVVETKSLFPLLCFPAALLFMTHAGFKLRVSFVTPLIFYFIFAYKQ